MAQTLSQRSLTLLEYRLGLACRRLGTEQKLERLVRATANRQNAGEQGRR